MLIDFGIQLKSSCEDVDGFGDNFHLMKSSNVSWKCVSTKIGATMSCEKDSISFNLHENYVKRSTQIIRLTRNPTLKLASKN